MSEFQVNTYTTGDQSKPSVVTLSNLSSWYDSVVSMFTENTQENVLHQTLMDTIAQQNVDIADNQEDQDYVAFNMLEMDKNNVNLSDGTTDGDTLIGLESVIPADGSTCYQDETVYLPHQDMPLDHVA